MSDEAVRNALTCNRLRAGVMLIEGQIGGFVTLSALADSWNLS